MAAEKKHENQEVLDWLRETFPNAFFKHASQVRPFVLGIMDEILDFYERLSVPPFSRKQIRSAISFYTASKAYLKCQTPGAGRINLAGIEEDRVSQSQADYAKERLEQRTKRPKRDAE